MTTQKPSDVIYYFIFPIDIKIGEKVYRTSANPFRDLKQIGEELSVEFRQTDFIKDDVYVIFSCVHGLNDFFVKEVVRNWLIHQCNIHRHKHIYSTSELYAYCSKK